MMTTNIRERTLADYRPQHDDDCDSRDCEKCGDWSGGLLHVDYGSNPRIWPDRAHAFSPGKPCSCGLDALLASVPPPASQETSTREWLIKRVQWLSERLDAVKQILDTAYDGADLHNSLIDLFESVAPAAPPEPTVEDVVCEHGTAMDVHCCNCHSGFIFDPKHKCGDRNAKA